MTTTADKIKVMQAFEDGLKIQLRGRGRERWDEVITTTLHWNWEAFEYRITPADPEALECWVAVVTVKAHRYILRFSQNHKTAIEDISKRESLVHMREVTPQDEQDRLDAKLWREHIKVVKANM